MFELNQAWTDALAEKWLDLQRREAQLEAERRRLHARLVQRIRKAGRWAPKSRTMRILEGGLYDLVAIYGYDVMVNQGAAAKICGAWPRSLTRKLFERQVRYALVDGAERAIAQRNGNYGRAFWAAITRKPRCARIAARRRIVKGEKKKAA
jgi:hypothetical protein